MSRSGKLAGKVAVVTGAGSKGGIGTGAAMAIRFARERAKVVVLNRSADAAEATVAAIREEGGECIAVVADVAQKDDCLRAAKETVAAFGHADVLVNNAATSRADTIADGPEEVWDLVVNVKLKGAVQMSRSFIPHLRRGGAIINISSIAGIRRPPLNRLSYSISNGAIVTMTGVMAVQLGSRGIRVNCIVPGQLWTPIAERTFAQGRTAAELAEIRAQRATENPLQMEGTAWDVAGAALFFAGEDARWVTGQTLIVDGGYLC